MILLDTNICITIINAKPEAVLERFKNYRLGETGLCSVVAAELAFGVAKSGSARNRQALEMFLAARRQHPLPAQAVAWQWSLNARSSGMPATMLSARSMKAPAQIARVHAKPRTGVWPQQVVGAPGVAFSVAMPPSRGSFDRQMTKITLSRPLRVRRTEGWSSGDLLRLT